MLIFGIILVVINFEFISGCKINYNFKRIAVAPGVVKICTDTLCANSFSYYEMGVHYFACMWDTHVVRPMRIYWVAREMRWGNEDYNYCIDNSAIHQWSTLCIPKTELYFIKNFGARQTDAFTLECGPWRAELPLSDRPRIQVNPFYPRAVFLHYNLPVKISDIFYIEQICTTNIVLKCTSYSLNCIECVDSKCAIVSEDYPLCYGHCFKWNMTLKVEKIDRKNIKMQLSSYDDWYQNNTYFPTIFDKVDVHNSVTCISTKFMVYIKREDETSTDLISSFDVKPNEPDQISFYCFLGVDSTVFNYNKIIIIRRTVTVLTKKMTVLKATRLDHHNKEVPVSSTLVSKVEIKYYSNTKLTCEDLTHTIYIYHLRKKVDLPISQHFCDDTNVCGVHVSNVLYWNVVNLKFMAFIRCYDGYRFAAPLILYVAMAPVIKFYNTYPWYNTLYILPGFIFGCETDKGKVSVECEACGLITLERHIFNDTNIAFSIPPELDVNTDITLICRVSLLDGMKFAISRTFVLAGLFSLTINVDQIIPVMGVNITCKKYFTVIKNNEPHREFTFQPIWMKANNFSYKTDAPQFKIPGNPEENVSVTYTYCCPYLPVDVKAGVIDPYSMLECPIYRHLIVAKTIRVEYNLDLNIVYSGQILRCYFCVNFSTDAYPVYVCNSSQQVKSFISMTVINPGGVKSFFNERTEVVTPTEEVNSNGPGYYNIAEYDVFIKCKMDTHTYSPTIQITVHNCDTYPPDIFVSPPDKTLLMVGDKIGCDVYLEFCKGKINYTISIINANKEEFIYEQTSKTLERTQMGSHIRVQCSAGTSNRKWNYRFYRVCGEPQGISITNGSIFDIPSSFKKLFVHGDYLECSVEAFPPPVYEWTQTIGPSLIYTIYRYALIRELDYAGRYTLICDASNDYGSMRISYDFIVYNEQINDRNDDSCFKPVVAVLCLLFLISFTLSATFIHYEIISNLLYYLHLKKLLDAPPTKESEKHVPVKTGKVIHSFVRYSKKFDDSVDYDANIPTTKQPQ